MEIELKFRVENFKEIRKQVEVMGGKLSFTKTQNDIYFRHSLDKEDKWILRIRNGRLLTVKTGTEGMWDEEELQISDKHPNPVKFCETLGFRKELTINKHREQWTFKEFVICFDEIEGLGKFVEIEGSSWEAIGVLATVIGIRSEAIKTGYVKMLLGT